MHPCPARLPRAHDEQNAHPTVRAASRGDVPALLELENAAFAGDRLTRRSLARFVRGTTSRFMVAGCNGTLAGYVILLLHRRRRSARIYSLAVGAGFAGRGIGRVLVETACDAARQAGRSAVTLEVRCDNRRAIDLYRRAGFAETARVEDYYEDGEAALRMIRPLCPAGGTPA